MSEETTNNINEKNISGSLPEHDLDRVLDVKVDVTVELGRRKMRISEILQLVPNAVLEFFKKTDDPLDIRVNGRLMAHGEPVVMGNRYGIRITDIVNSKNTHGQIDLEDT